MTANFLVCLATIQITLKCAFAINNRMRSPIPPSNMALDDIPMFLTITFDDALHGQAHEIIESITNHVNRNGEQIPLVYFISNEFSDYALIQQRYLQGSEIAIHTVTHTTNVNDDITKWYYEIKKSRQLMSTHADIPLSDLNGFRAPFLAKSDVMFQVLTGLQPQFVYDSTVISALDNGLFDWPYTFDAYEPYYPYRIGQGPQKSYPGFWEMPIYELYADVGNAQTNFDVMDYSGNYTLLLDAFQDNFIHRMSTNKAPMGLYFHSPWLTTDSNMNVLNDFIDWVLSLDNTWIVTNKDVIDWVNNPVPNAQYSRNNHNQLMNGKTDFISCGYDAGIFRTVQDECPLVIPHDLQWNESQLISTAISITSTNDNILTTEMDVCTNDTYTTYENQVVYCGNPPNQEIVKYKDGLYQCQWWTQRDKPDKNSVWKEIKQCILYSHTFVKGTMEPYGAVTVFQDTELNIRINPAFGYGIDTVSVTLNASDAPHTLSVFDDYQMITDWETQSVTVTILFTTIRHSEYEIEFSFKNVTQSPTRSPTIATINPTNAPTSSPTITPTVAPTSPPTSAPTQATHSPSIATHSPSFSPSIVPDRTPNINPTAGPTATMATVATVNVDLCSDDIYAVYNDSIVYCGVGRDQQNKIVRYEDSLYECEYWTLSEAPSSTDVGSPWLWVKECRVSESETESGVGASANEFVTLLIVFTSLGVCIVMCWCIARSQQEQKMVVSEEIVICHSATNTPSSGTVECLRTITHEIPTVETKGVAYTIPLKVSKPNYITNPY